MIKKESNEGSVFKVFQPGESDSVLLSDGEADETKTGIKI